MSTAIRTGTAIFLCLMIACPVVAQDAEPAAAKAEDKKSEPKKKSAEEVLAEKVKKARKLTHDLKMAKLELEVANLTVEIKKKTAGEGVSKAGRALDLAKRELDAFLTEEAPLAIEQAMISLDRSRHGAEHAKDELAELVAMYKADEFAEMTKELVLKRGRRRLEIANRNLAVQETRLKHLKTSTHPRKKKELQGKLMAAEHALEKARLEQLKAEIEVRIIKAKAVFKAEELERDLGDAEKDVEKLAQKKT